MAKKRHDNSTKEDLIEECLAIVKYRLSTMTRIELIKFANKHRGVRNGK